MSALAFTTVSAMLVTLPNVSSSTNATSAQLCLFAQDAEGIMNAKLSKLYTLPFTFVVSAGHILHGIATDLACYRFLTRRVFTSERANKSEWPDKFREAMDLLDEIVSGEIPLLDSSGGVIPASTGQVQIWSNTMGYQPTMTEDDTEFQFVDEDKIRDIRDDRGQFIGPVLT